MNVNEELGKKHLEAGNLPRVVGEFDGRVGQAPSRVALDTRNVGLEA